MDQPYITWSPSISSGSSQPRDQTLVSHIAGRFFTIWAPREALEPLLLASKMYLFSWCLFQSWYVPVYPMYVFSLSSQNSVFWIFPRVFKLNYQFGCLSEPFQIHYLFLEASQKECHIMILGPSVFHKCYFLLCVPYCCPLFSCPWWLNHHMLDSPQG